MRYALSSISILLIGIALLAQRPPHGQDKMPGPALSPAEALKKMTVPEGFTVELVAAEPDIINPIGMTFDEKGRVWITESLEYPRREPGPGRDRVKCIEIGPDGTASKVTTFAEGLNIPSGIAVGHGGVWVANAPDILFYKIGPDGKAAGKPEVVVTGFGRTDTHELPNSLTWGPDGWLYGWNGVFNYSHVKHKGKEYKFTCAIFRIHPKTHDFELFCEGTSNPWGIAINENGDLFASACVIDHLWHLTETGYYIRQGGPYPPHTWPARSIVKHKHQKAAYCGITWFDSDAYPEKYRGKLFMGNIHGGCINVDSLKRDGSTYFGSGEPDFLTANDQWFMPVVQKVGPDGSLYILDWYDRYHCYQDANRDPKGIDRLRGRLYRVRYKDTPRTQTFDLSKQSDEELLQHLKSPNVYYRDIAQRILTERGLTTKPAAGLKGLILSDAPRPARLHALWAMIGSGPLEPELHAKLLTHDDSTFRAWAVRAAGNQGKIDNAVAKTLATILGTEKSPDVLVQLAIANHKLDLGGISTYLKLLERAPTDKLLPHIVWQNMHPLLETQGDVFAGALATSKPEHLGEILPRSVERILAAAKPQPVALAGIYESARKTNVDLAARVLRALITRVQNGELSPESVAALKTRMAPALARDRLMRGLAFDAVLLLALFQDPAAIAQVKTIAGESREGEERRMQTLEVLMAIKDESARSLAERMLFEFRRPHRPLAITAIGRFDDDEVATVLLRAYQGFDDEQKPRVIDVLTQRDNWGKALMKHIADNKLLPSVIGVNQARRLLLSKDKELVNLTTKHWGTLREERNPEREKVVAQMRDLLSRTKGDPKRGLAVYKNLCGQCHKLHGEGAEVGPDVTLNGRANFDQLLSNVFDPSLIIGPGYNGVTVFDTRGRVVSGLLVEEGPNRIVLKVQGGKQEIIPRKAIEKVEYSKLSLMPEGVEKQLKPQEIADLFALLCLDKHPDDATARRIPGTPKGLFGER
jgi:putative membrane-bound dehydrogenase-like protein